MGEGGKTKWMWNQFGTWEALRRSRKGRANLKLFVIIPFPITYLNENSSWFTQKRRKWSNFGGRKWMEDTFLCLIVEMNTITLVYPDARIFAPPAISLLLLSDGAISPLTSPYQPGISRKHPFHTLTTPGMICWKHNNNNLKLLNSFSQDSLKRS